MRGLLWISLFPIILFAVHLEWIEGTQINSDDFLVLTVATEESEALDRYLRSARVNDLRVKVLGLREEWAGGDMMWGTGGGQKVNLLKKELDKLKDNTHMIVLFTDSYDILFLGSSEKILIQFELAQARVLFGAEDFCWPDEDVAKSYPIDHHRKKYLNSGGFIGYASDLYSLVTSASIGDADDDQRFYTTVYLNETLRNKHNIKLDSEATIFHNMNGATKEVKLQVDDDGFAYLLNTAFNTRPLVLHGNGPPKIKTVFNSLGNYLANVYNFKDGCVSCMDGMISLANFVLEEYPTIVLGIFIERRIPFLEEFFRKIVRLDYPKSKITLFIHNSDAYHHEVVTKFIREHGVSYAALKIITPADTTKEWHARNLAVDLCAEVSCDYYLSVDAEAHLVNPYMCKLLIEQNRQIIAPLLVGPHKGSNFWGEIDEEGYHVRGNDFLDIVKGERRGLWNVPLLSAVYLVNGSLIRNRVKRPSYILNLLDADIAFCTNNIYQNTFMFISNIVDFGYLITPDDFDRKEVQNDFFRLFDKRCKNDGYSSTDSPAYMTERRAGDWLMSFVQDPQIGFKDQCHNLLVEKKMILKPAPK